MNKRINITSGDCLNELLQKEHEEWIPFREALLYGTHQQKPFSPEFIEERIQSLKTTKEEYLDKLNPIIEFIKHINDYEKIILWFGDEPFCIANYSFLIDLIQNSNFNGKVILNIVNENNGEIIETKNIEKE